MQTNLNREDVVTAKVVTVRQTGTKHKASGQLSLTGKYAKKMKYIDIRSNFVSKLGVKDKCADSCDASAKGFCLSIITLKLHICWCSSDACDGTLKRLARSKTMRVDEVKELKNYMDTW